MRGPGSARPAASYFLFGAINHEHKQNNTRTPDPCSTARYQQLWQKRRIESTRQCRSTATYGVGDYGSARAGHEY